MREAALEFITDMLLIILSADLLYLYFNGAWIEPNTIIATSEIIVLVAIIGLGLYRLFRYITRVLL